MNHDGLSISNLSCSRNQLLLFSNLEFSLTAGEILQILGPNGVGKSTLLKILAGLRQPDAGVISWNGTDIFDELDSYHNHLAYLGHNHALKSHLTVWETLELDLRRSASKSEVLAILKKFGLEDKINQETISLSQGQQQRLAIAGIILSQRKIWLLDEPFSSIDHASFISLQYEFLDHLQRGGLIILTSHRELSLPEPIRNLCQWCSYVSASAAFKRV